MSTESTAEVAFDRASLLVWTALATSGTLLAAIASTPVWGISLGSVVLALAYLVRVPTPSDDYLDIGLAVVAAVPLLVDEIAAVGAIYAFGLLGSRLIVIGRDGKEGVAVGFLSTAIGAGAYAVAFLATRSRLEGGSGLEPAVADMVAVTAGGLAWFVVTALARALVRYRRERFALRYLWLVGLADWPVVVGLVSAGGLFAFTFPAMRWWAAPLAIMTYGFSHLAFVRYHGTRVTYGQTIRALARIPEAAQLAPEGHALRTAALARAVGQDLGLSPSVVNELEYASLMHDIGRITLNEPAILKAGYTDDDIAAWGAEIISEAPYLRAVATAVRQQHQPFRRPGEERDESLPIGAKVIRVASAYDQAVSEMGLMPIEAVEVLHRGAAYDFDPLVVRSLRRVLVWEGTIAY